MTQEITIRLNLSQPRIVIFLNNNLSLLTKFTTIRQTIPSAFQKPTKSVVKAMYIYHVNFGRIINYNFYLIFCVFFIPLTRDKFHVIWTVSRILEFHTVTRNRSGNFKIRSSTTYRRPVIRSQRCLSVKILRIFAIQNVVKNKKKNNKCVIIPSALWRTIFNLYNATVQFHTNGYFLDRCVSSGRVFRETATDS